MRKIISILILIVVIGCTSKTNNNRKEKIPLDTIETEIKQLFKVNALNDTLQAFIDSVDSIPNPYGSPKLNRVTIAKKGKDTIFFFTASTMFHLFYETIPPPPNQPPLSSLPKLIGGYRIGKEYVAVYYRGFEKMTDIINEELLSIECLEKGMEIGNCQELYDWDHFPSMWIYKLNRDSLEIIKK